MITFDNTTLADFKRCMRYGYFRHIRGWAEDKLNPALLFGVAWHKAMSAIWSGSPHAAYEAFLSSWLEGGGPPSPSVKDVREYGPRTLQRAREMLAEYATQRASDVARVTVESDEQFFLTPLNEGVSYAGMDENVHYCGTIDKVLKTELGYVILEHKTTSSGYGSGFSSDWLEGWRLNSQLDGYLFAAGKKYPEGSVSAVIDAALVSSRGMAFEFISVKRTASQIKAWFTHTKNWISQILYNWRLIGMPYASWTNEAYQFFPTPPYDEVLEQFPLNTESCVKYGKRCPYWNICTLYPQPQAIMHVPAGFVQKYWRPQDGKTD